MLKDGDQFASVAEGEVARGILFGNSDELIQLLLKIYSRWNLIIIVRRSNRKG